MSSSQRSTRQSLKFVNNNDRAVKLPLLCKFLTELLYCIYYVLIKSKNAQHPFPLDKPGHLIFLQLHIVGNLTPNQVLDRWSFDF